MSIFRALMVAVATMLVAGGVAACSKAPVPVGLAAVGIGPDGQWIGYLQVCSGQVDGGSEGSSTTVGAVHFTKADLAALSIGQVIHWSGSGDTMVVGTEDEFRANACTAYDE